MIRKLFLHIIILFFPITLCAQNFLLNGVVYDSTRRFIIPAVRVTATNGNMSYTDSAGAYSILVTNADSLQFTYRNKSTHWFPVSEMKYNRQFDIALQVAVRDGYKMLREVIVVGKSYRQDSLENRIKYQKIFDANPGGLSVNTGGGLYGGAGLDPNDIINLFRFRRNRSLKVLQNRLLQEETDKYIDYRFNKDLVKQITGFTGNELDHFMKVWRPDYELVAFTTELQFHSYILEASRFYTRGVMPWNIRTR